MLIFKILLLTAGEISQNGQKKLKQAVLFQKCWAIFVP